MSALTQNSAEGNAAGLGTPEQPPFEAVSAALQVYFDGLYHSDAEMLRKVLHPLLTYVTVSGEERLHLGLEDYLPVVAARPAPSASGQPRQDRIVSVQFAGPRTAFACVNCAINDRYFTDFLSLIYDEGRWQIISKVFHYDIVEPA
ncbi:nuclear transport factor 2 family protein [Rhodovibrionaceae bacterium A322]